MLVLTGRAFFLLGAGAILGGVVNFVRSDGVRLASFALPSSCTVVAASATAAVGMAPVEVLAPSEAVRLCGDPGTMLADVRPAYEFAQGHVAGAIHLPCTASGSTAGAAIELLATHRTLIVYGEGADDAKLVAHEMRRRINRPDLRVLVVAGGFPAWSEAGLACSSGPCPDCQTPGGHR